MLKLKFSRGNAKLDALEAVVGGQVWTFSTLSGWTCPYANECLSKAVEQPNGHMKIVDGPNNQHRCFSASQEVLFPNVYKARKHNFDLLKSAGNNQSKLVDMISEALPSKAKYIRIHVGGDFFTLNYMRAWCDIARNNPEQNFYAYTKSLPFWVKLLASNYVPDNLILTASRGGRADELIKEYGLREAVVVYSKAHARKLKYVIDHDDSHAALPKFRHKSFALLIHGIQPAGSEAAKAMKKLGGVGGKSSYKRAGK